jgi:hypothetical protein
MHFKLLADGQSVTLEDGTVVRPEQVRETNTLKTEACAILFIPSSDHA